MILLAASGRTNSGETSFGLNEERIAKLEPIDEPGTTGLQPSQEDNDDNKSNFLLPKFFYGKSI